MNGSTVTLWPLVYRYMILFLLVISIQLIIIWSSLDVSIEDKHFISFYKSTIFTGPHHFFQVLDLLVRLSWVHLQLNIWKIIYLSCGERHKDVDDHRSYIHSLSSYEIKAGIRTHDLCDTGAVFYQLSYPANWELITS